MSQYHKGYEHFLGFGWLGLALECFSFLIFERLYLWINAHMGPMLWKWLLNDIVRPTKLMCSNVWILARAAIQLINGYKYISILLCIGA